jgi:hypothetical protein
LADKIRQRDEILSGDLFRLADEKNRRKLLVGLEHGIAAKTQEVDDLAAVVGDPETVVDARGWRATGSSRSSATFTSRSPSP